MAFVLRHLGLRQRIAAMLAVGGATAVVIVGLSLRELNALQQLNEVARAAEERREVINKATDEAVGLALSSATTFASLGLDLSLSERRAAIAQGEGFFSRFEALQGRIAPMLAQFLAADEVARLAASMNEIGRSWRETKEEIESAEQEEMAFHLLSVVKHTEEVRGLILKAESIASRDAKNAALQVDGAPARRSARSSPCCSRGSPSSSPPESPSCNSA